MTFRNPQHIDGAEDVGFDRPDRVVLVVDRRGGAGEIVDPIDFVIVKKDAIDDVVLDQLEVGMVEEVGDVLPFAGKEVVDAKDLVLIDEAIAEMTSQEPGAARYQNCLHRAGGLPSHWIGRRIIRRFFPLTLAGPSLG